MVRITGGAYVELERILAQEHGIEDHLYTNTLHREGEVSW